MEITTLDILTVIVILIFAVLGYRKGILKTVISIIGTLLASLMSSVLSNPIAEAIYNGGFKPTILAKSESAMKLAQQEGTSYLDSLMETMPKFVGNSLKGFGITAPDLSAAANNGAAQIERTLSPIIISFISVIVSIVLFAALLVVAKFVCAMIYKTMDETPLNFFDGLVGGVIGILEGFILIMLAAFIIRIATPHMKKAPDIISAESISHSTVFEGIYDSPILTGIVSAVTDSPNTGALVSE